MNEIVAPCRVHGVPEATMVCWDCLKELESRLKAAEDVIRLTVQASKATVWGDEIMVMAFDAADDYFQGTAPEQGDIAGGNRDE